MVPSSSPRRASSALTSGAAACASAASTTWRVSIQSPATRTRKPAPVRSIVSRAPLADFDLALHRHRDCVHQLAQAALERAEQRCGGRARFRRLGARRKDAARQAPILVGQLDEARKDARHAERSRVAAVDAAEQRFGQVIDGLGTVMLFDKLGHRLIAGHGPGCAQQLHRHAQLGAPADQASRQQRQDLGRHHHHQAVRQRHQAAVAAHERHAQVVVRADDLAGQTKIGDHFERGRLGGKETIRSGLDGASLQVHRLDHAAQARARFDDGGRGAALGQIVRGSQAGDAATDDDGVRHGERR